MTKKTEKQKSHSEWAKICTNLNEVIHTQHADIDTLEKQIDSLEEQLTMSIGVIKYLELQIVRSNSV
jgi:polyhydroxyalkanoate synthesis regulator phasin